MLPWVIAFLLLAAGAVVAGVLWQTRFNVPRLMYTLLPSYEIPDVILVGGVLIENRGRKPAPNVKVTVEFAGDAATTIHHMKVQSWETAVLRSGGERFNFATISARTLRPGGKIFVNWAASRDVQPQIHLTSYQPTQASFLSRLLPRKQEA